MYVGNRTISENLNIYPKKLGILMPLSSAMAFTMKLGPLPIYVIEPKNTAPMEIAFNNISGIPATNGMSMPLKVNTPLVPIFALAAATDSGKPDATP